MSNDLQTEQRLTRVEERTQRMQTDIGGILAKWPGLESRVATLWELYPRIQKSIDSIDARLLGFIVGGASAVVGAALLWLKSQIGL